MLAGTKAFAYDNLWYPDQWDLVAQAIAADRSAQGESNREIMRERRQSAVVRAKESACSRVRDDLARSISAVVRCCPVCRRMYEASLYQVRNGRGTTCSRECAGRLNQAKRPVREIEFGGERMSLFAWSAKLRLPYRSLSAALGKLGSLSAAVDHCMANRRVGRVGEKRRKR